MITNKDIRVENGFLIINGDKYPLDGQFPEAIMQIVEDNSDSTPTENSIAPVTSGGVYTALDNIKTDMNNLITADNTTVNNSDPIAAGGRTSYTAVINKDGYTPLGVIGVYGSGTGGLSFADFYIGYDTQNENWYATVYVVNSTSSSITPSYITFRILFIKS